ncbi:hypothetical protein TNCV_1166861 [Trichonephila clavipes]|uniref:Uncharacterized protein n=1 Tax=Trichonephila clavipes TaxID=2585209 RepID=A0A8X6T1G9_TRICX|nr:hypothetical protein TNCV_1166861 [Trichonephila clavipes]
MNPFLQPQLPRNSTHKVPKTAIFFGLSLRPYLLTNRMTQKLAEGTEISGMIRGIRFDHLYSDIPIG